MAFVLQMYNAFLIDWYKKNLQTEKNHAIKIQHGLVPKYSLYDKYRHLCFNIGKRLRNFFCGWHILPQNTCVHRLIRMMKSEGTLENYIMKSFVGFVSGIFLTYVIFMFLVFQLNFKLSGATMLCSIFGCILTIGLAFSNRIRCIVLMILPLFFSKRGRQALMAYAFILAITGPAKNTLHNMGILSESLACGQEQLKTAVKQILEIVKKPFYAIRDALKNVVKSVKYIVKKIKNILLEIKRLIMGIYKFIKGAFQWLGSVVNMCNKKVGTPFQRCMRVMDSAIMDCNAKLGPMFSWLCSITYVGKYLCFLVKYLDFICMLLDFISDSIVGTVIKKVRVFVRHMRAMFYVRIKFSHSFQFETKHSKSLTEITQGIVTEIRERTENMLALFDVMSCATSFFFLFLVVKAMHYRYQFLTNETFDNHFITDNLRDIDYFRAKLDKETIFPLNQREKNHYIEATSLRLVTEEKVKLSKSAIFLGLATLKLTTHMIADYSLYWVLATIRYHARYQNSVETPKVVSLHVGGKGILSDLYRSIVKAFQPLGTKMEIDTVPCLPDPIPPDYDRYIQIASLIVLCWILAVFEPYGLRLRHSVMCYYNPERSRERAVWLYNHILRARMSFLKFARRQLRRNFKGGQKYSKVTCMEFIRAHFSNRCILYFIGKDPNRGCLLCGEIQRDETRDNFVECLRQDCIGFFCLSCYKDLENLCTICRTPMDYGDLSDVSEEIDSSDDAAQLAKQEKKERRRTKKHHQSHTKGGDNGSDSDQKGDDDDKNAMDVSSTDYSTHPSGSDTDTDYSFTYQKTKANLPALSQSRQSFTDVERQRQPDEASMTSFQTSYHNIGYVRANNKTSTEVIKNTESNVLVNLNSPQVDYASMLAFGELPRVHPSKNPLSSLELEDGNSNIDSDLDMYYYEQPKKDAPGLLRKVHDKMSTLKTAFYTKPIVQTDEALSQDSEDSGHSAYTLTTVYTDVNSISPKSEENSILGSIEMESDSSLDLPASPIITNPEPITAAKQPISSPIIHLNVVKQQLLPHSANVSFHITNVQVRNYFNQHIFNNKIPTLDDMFDETVKYSVVDEKSPRTCLDIFTRKFMPQTYPPSVHSSSTVTSYEDPPISPSIPSTLQSYSSTSSSVIPGRKTRCESSTSDSELFFREKKTGLRKKIKSLLQKSAPRKVQKETSSSESLDWLTTRPKSSVYRGDVTTESYGDVVKKYYKKLKNFDYWSRYNTLQRTPPTRQNWLMRILGTFGIFKKHASSCLQTTKPLKSAHAKYSKYNVKGAEREYSECADLLSTDCSSCNEYMSSENCNHHSTECFSNIVCRKGARAPECHFARQRQLGIWSTSAPDNRYMGPSQSRTVDGSVEPAEILDDKFESDSSISESEFTAVRESIENSLPNYKAKPLAARGQEGDLTPIYIPHACISETSIPTAVSHRSRRRLSHNSDHSPPSMISSPVISRGTGRDVNTKVSSLVTLKERKTQSIVGGQEVVPSSRYDFLVKDPLAQAGNKEFSVPHKLEAGEAVIPHKQTNPVDDTNSRFEIELKIHEESTTQDGDKTKKILNTLYATKAMMVDQNNHKGNYQVPNTIDSSMGDHQLVLHGGSYCKTNLEESAQKNSPRSISQQSANYEDDRPCLCPQCACSCNPPAPKLDSSFHSNFQTDPEKKRPCMCSLCACSCNPSPAKIPSPSHNSLRKPEGNELPCLCSQCARSCRSSPMKREAHRHDRDEQSTHSKRHGSSRHSAHYTLPQVKDVDACGVPVVEKCTSTTHFKELAYQHTPAFGYLVDELERKLEERNRFLRMNSPTEKKYNSKEGIYPPVQKYSCCPCCRCQRERSGDVAKPAKKHEERFKKTRCSFETLSKPQPAIVECETGYVSSLVKQIDPLLKKPLPQFARPNRFKWILGPDKEWHRVDGCGGTVKQKVATAATVGRPHHDISEPCSKSGTVRRSRDPDCHRNPPIDPCDEGCDHQVCPRSRPPVTGERTDNNWFFKMNIPSQTEAQKCCCMNVDFK